MYDLFVQDANKQVESLKEERIGLLKSKDYLISQVKQFEEYLRKETKVDYDSLINQTSKIGLITINLPAPKTYVIYLIDINKALQIIDDKLAKLKIKTSLKYKDYALVVKGFNKKIGNQMLLGYTMNLGNAGLFGVRIKKNLYGVNRVDWAASNKLKADIIARGGIPFEAIEYDSTTGKKTSDNGGEHWLITHAKESDIWLYWDKFSCHLKNKAFYSFKYTYGGNEGDEAGLIVKLNRLLKTDPTIVTRFKEFKMDAEPKMQYLINNEQNKDRIQQGNHC